MSYNDSQQTDAELGMTTADPRDDLRMVLAHASTDGLQAFYRAVLDNRLIAGSYISEQAGRRHGCLMNFLLGVESKRELLEYDFGSADVRRAARRLVRFWDYHDVRLSRETLHGHVSAALAARQQANLLEEQAICRAHRLSDLTV